MTENGKLTRRRRGAARVPLVRALSKLGLASRREARALIAAGRVRINGDVAIDPAMLVAPERTRVEVDDVRRERGKRRVLVLHKPRGVVTTLSDPEGRPTVRDFLTGVPVRVYPVGRLDYDSEGLLLLTDDGALARDLMHPSSGVEKTYRAKVRGFPEPETLRRLARGIQLEGRRTGPARVRVVEAGSNPWLELVLSEGRNRQVRKMLQAVGHPVQKLRRIRYGGVDLGRLPAGGLRPLRPAEVERLKRVTRRKRSS